MIHSSLRTGAAVSALALLSLSAAWGAAAPADLGALDAESASQSMSVTIALKPGDAAGAEALLQHLSTPNDALYQKFLTPDEIAQRFGPSQATVDKVTASLERQGLTVERTGTALLQATGSPATFEKVFQTSLHQFQSAAGERFRAPASRAVVPQDIAASVQGVIGLSTAPAFHSNMKRSPIAMTGKRHKGGGSPPTATTDMPGLLTVADFAELYDVNPLYAKGVTGKGTTLAIVTLASFTTSDVFGYWNSLGLKTNANRLSVVNVDGGPGAPSDASGSDETTLDVEQSGGIAPGANIIVYQAPNTNQGFLDAFAQAIKSNKPDTISTSWGEWEFLDNLANSPVTDPFSGETVSSLQATHELLLEAALQGQSFYAAAGDAGAFDESGELPDNFSTPLSVDYPASDTAITAGGGLTLPGPQEFTLNDGSTFTINVPKLRVWGWDYLEPLCTALGLDQAACGIFPGGGGGGVSVFFSLPFYQLGTNGVQTSQPGQVLTDDSTTPPTTVFNLPAHFRGRNVPDVSLNADPDTGYIIPYTSDKNGFEVEEFIGGTSFVAPQLNGVTALLDQKTGHRQGLMNPTFYLLGLLRSSAIQPVAPGDNWFYTGRNGYSPADGLGQLDVSALANTIR